MALSPHLRQPLWTSFSFTAAKSTATPGSLYEVIPKFEAGNQHDIMSIGFSSALIRHRPKIIFPLKYRFRAPPGYLSLNIEEAARSQTTHREFLLLASAQLSWAAVSQKSTLVLSSDIGLSISNLLGVYCRLLRMM
jgi:hypothetical protein